MTEFRDVEKHCFQLALTDTKKLEKIFQEQAPKLFSGSAAKKNGQFELSWKVESHSLTEKSLKKVNEELKTRLDGFVAEAEKEKKKVGDAARVAVILELQNKVIEYQKEDERTMKAIKVGRENMIPRYLKSTSHLGWLVNMMKSSSRLRSRMMLQKTKINQIYVCSPTSAANVSSKPILMTLGKLQRPMQGKPHLER
ncbi:hypothetical protein GIB67_034843 [Kingdonia uniflora]|uniref:Uncharacterized protein n=1 Tax=Kingdonia uniflora TaxID=39325 RepID=A0A7J7ME23_9MAGN|nr:hypothetical protein GIB67_034843 [Kingdonia uniflora]